MIIRNQIVFVYDVEVFPNLFTCSCINSESNKSGTWEISNLKNELPEIIKGFSNKKIYWATYNGKHYDDPIINYLIMNYDSLIRMPVWKITDEIKKFSDLIIKSGEEKFDSWTKYKYANKFKSFDLLTMMFSKKLRCSLKALEVTMQYSKVQEYEGDFDKPVPNTDIEKVKSYNLNDCWATLQLLNLKKDDINLRLAIEDEYGINALSSDGVKIGTEVLKKKYLEFSNKTWDEIKDLRSICETVNLKDIILPKINFKTKILQDLLSEMKTLTVMVGIKGWNKQFEFCNSLISIGIGGLHSINKPEIIIPNEDEYLIDYDASSLYPSLLISYGFYPKHLGKEFLDIYSKIRTERLEAKHNGDKIKNETYKLLLNSVTGNMQLEYSWLCDTEAVMKIRMNGQLFLLKLAEMLTSATDCKPIQYNTDGIFVLCKKKDKEIVERTIKEFEEFSLLTMEGEEFEAMYQFTINDYIAVKKGYSETKNPKLIKKKGLFIDKISLGKGMAPMVVPKALNAYFINGISPEDFLKNDTDIRDYCTYQKVDKKFKVEYDGKPVTHINRFYMSTNGKSLIRYSLHDGIKTNPTLLCASSPVTIINDFDDLSTEGKNINYNYYKREIYKIIDQMNTKQLSLF